MQLSADEEHVQRWLPHADLMNKVVSPLININHQHLQHFPYVDFFRLYIAVHFSHLPMKNIYFANNGRPMATNEV